MLSSLLAYGYLLIKKKREGKQMQGMAKELKREVI